MKGTVNSVFLLQNLINTFTGVKVTAFQNV